jgi:hypothetical protein
MNKSIQKDFPTAEMLTASEIIRKLTTINRWHHIENGYIRILFNRDNSH